LGFGALIKNLGKNILQLLSTLNEVIITMSTEATRLGGSGEVVCEPKKIICR
jgi:hypothetical protein